VPTPQPFTIAVPDEQLDDLRLRLARTRWPAVLHGGGWRLGADPTYLRGLLDDWRDGYDWRTQEERLNRYSHRRLEVDGCLIHYVYLGDDARSRPAVLLLHGWPYTFVELLDLAERLAERFEVVVPSLPGYIFSGVPDGAFFWRDVPRMFVELMAALGHERFIAHGSDIGGGVANRLAVQYPERLIGIHVTHTSVGEPGEAPLSDAEQQMHAESERWEKEDAAYSYMQETRPATLSYGLTDSPVGLAAWIVEKLHEWTDLEPHGDLERVWSRDRILTLLTLYWTTGSIGTSFLAYYENMQDPSPKPWRRVSVPAAFTIFARDISTPPREWADRGYDNIVRWTQVPHGGHFPAVEAVDLLADEIIQAASTFRAP
jgi:pimeloyl-ACP methyl ester carboxylesterase